MGGGRLVNLRAEKILWKIFPDINWLTQIENPLKIYIYIFSKIINAFCTSVLCHQQTDTNEPEEIVKVNTRAFNSSVGLQHNDLIGKSICHEEYKCCEVNQDTDELFIHPIKFCCIFLTACCPPIDYEIKFTYLLIYRPVSFACSAWFVLGI